MSTTAGSIIDAVLDRLDESRTAPIFWTRAELLQILNDGFIEFTLFAGQLTSERTYDLIGAKLQATPIGAIAVMHVSYGNRKIEKSSVELIDRNNPNWDAQSGLLQKWAPCGLDRWFVDRHPTAPGTSVTLVTLDDPTTLTESSVIDLDTEYIDALTEYTFHFARFKESGGELQQSMTNYDFFLNKAGHKGQRTFAQEFLVFSRDPNSDTGPDYSTKDRS
jgi:hypothetical protein